MRVKLVDVISPAPLVRCGDSEYPVLSMTMHDGIVLQSERFKKQLASVDQSAYKVVNRGQLVVGFPIDEGVLYVQKVADAGIMSPAYNIWDIDNAAIDADYLELCLHSPKAMQYYLDNLRGTTARRRSIPNSVLLDLPIYLPNKDVQRNTVKTIEKVSDLIAMRKKQLQKLDDLVKSRFVEMFGDGKYPTVKASDVCGFITKGTTPPTGEIYEEYESGRVPYLKVYNLSFTGELLFDSAPQYISGETHNKQLARSKVFPDDVLMNIVGPPLGKFSLVTNTFDEWNINQAIVIFRAKEKVLPRYLMAALMQPKVLRPFLEQAVGIRQLNLSLEQCRNLEFPLPLLEEQKEFVAFAEQTDKSKSAIQQSLDKLELLKKALMQKYFG